MPRVRNVLEACTRSLQKAVSEVTVPRREEAVGRWTGEAVSVGRTEVAASLHVGRSSNAPHVCQSARGAEPWNSDSSVALLDRYLIPQRRTCDVTIRHHRSATALLLRPSILYAQLPISLEIYLTVCRTHNVRDVYSKCRRVIYLHAVLNYFFNYLPDTSRTLT